MRIPATCKFCGYKLNLEVDDDCPPLKLEAWLPLAACNRCGDYHERLWRIGDKAQRKASLWNSVRLFERDATKRARFESLCRDHLTELTKRLSAVVCEFHKVPNIWHKDFVDQIMEQPNKADTILKLYESGMKKVQNQVAESRSLPYADPD